MGTHAGPSLSYRLEDERERRTLEADQLLLVPEGVLARLDGLATWSYALRWDGTSRRHRLPRTDEVAPWSVVRAVQIDCLLLSLALLEDLNSEFRPLAQSELNGPLTLEPDADISLRGLRRHPDGRPQRKTKLAEYLERSGKWWALPQGFPEQDGMRGDAILISRAFPPLAFSEQDWRRIRLSDLAD